MKNSKNLKPKEVKDLTEIINEYIALQTSSSLSKLLNESIKYNVMILDKKYFNPKKIKLGSDELVMCGVRLHGKGDIHVEICYAIKMKYAKMIASKLLGKDESYEIDEMGASAIQEVANILTGSFFNAMSIGTGFRVDISTPDYLQTDLASMVNDSAKDVISPLSESAIIADAELVGEKSGIRIHMLIVQNSDDARKLLEQNSKNNFSKLSSISSYEYKTGGANLELDELVQELEKEVV